MQILLWNEDAGDLPIIYIFKKSGFKPWQAMQHPHTSPTSILRAQREDNKTTPTNNKFPKAHSRTTILKHQMLATLFGCVWNNFICTKKKPNMYSRVQLRVFCTRSHPPNIFRINSSKYVMFAWVRTNLLLRDSISGPSLCFFFSAFSCLWVVSRCPLRVLATDMNDVTSWSPINEATWRYTLGGALRYTK